MHRLKLYYRLQRPIFRGVLIASHKVQTTAAQCMPGARGSPSQPPDLQRLDRRAFSPLSSFSDLKRCNALAYLGHVLSGADKLATISERNP